MDFISLLIIAVGLSMDAFAVSICKGLAQKGMCWRNALTAGLYFGGFQALMPLIGFFLGTSFRSLITSVDHWIAFVLLAIIGTNMIVESRKKQTEIDPSCGFKSMIVLAVATSIDALAVGVTFAFLQVNIWQAIAIIGITTFVFSVVGYKVGNIFGTRFKSKAELAGGVILILMGLKILIEHLIKG